MEFRGFVNGDYQSMAVTADQERTVNWFYEPMESQGATSRHALYPTPGPSPISTAGASPGRAHFFWNGREFAVEGATFYEISEAGVFTSRGTVSNNSNPATICSNGDGGNQLFITSGDNGYYYNLLTNTLTAIAALSGKATIGDHLDGYFLALDAATATFYISDLLDGATWDPTQFAQRSAAADPWVSMKVSGQYVWLFGEQTSEVWYDAGTSPFPFAKYPSGLVPYGIAAPFSRAVSGGSIIWLGASRDGERFVLQASGFTPVVVSDYPRQRIFAEYETVADAQADTMVYNGHPFYILTFPTENTTWVWDSGTNKWVEWLTWIAENNAYIAWRPRWHALAFGQHRMLDSETGNLYNVRREFALDVDLREQRRLRRSPALVSELNRIYVSSFELDVQPANTGNAVVSPQIMLRISRDGGQTWGAWMSRPSGKQGEYDTRVKWLRLGYGRRLVFEIVTTHGQLITNAYLGVSGVTQEQRAS